MRFKDKTVVVTGGGSGIGRAIALAFAHEGGRVLVASYVEPEVEAVAEEIRASGGRALAVAADVRHSADMETMVARAIGEWAVSTCW